MLGYINDVMDYMDYIKFLSALLFVLSLMGGLAYALKYFGFGQGGITNIGQKRALKIVEILPIDTKRKLAVFSYKNKEHVVLMGQGAETLIATHDITSEDKGQASNE